MTEVTPSYSLGNKSRRRLSDGAIIGILLVLHLAVVLARLGFVLNSPSEFLLTPSGDGVKTYFALLYYVQNDHGLQFTGMNYPFGDLLLYTDGLPLFAWLLKVWKNLFGLSLAGTVAALNSLLVLGSLPTTPLVYTLLRRCHVGQLFGAVATLTIVFLSPQFHRFGGHLSLTFTFVVPLLWYLQVRIGEELTTRKQAIWTAVYVGTSLLLGLVHPYYLLHALLLPVATALVQAAQQWRRIQRWWVLPAWLLSAGVAPVVLFRVVTGLFDTIADRPINPYGFWVYHTNAASVFGPVVEPFAQVFRAVFRLPESIWEGYAYIGLPVVLGLLLLLCRMVGQLWRRRPGLVFRPVLPAPLRATAWAAVPILLFAMAWPFTWPGFEKLLDYLQPLKQFRALGRFAWIFYYVIAVLAALQYWQLYRYLRQRGAARFGQFLLVLLVVVWGMEAKFQLEYATHGQRNNRVAYSFIGSDHNYREMLAQAGYNPEVYQAILPLPYYAIGSEKFDISGGAVSMFEGFRAALSLRRPLAAVMMSRTSAEQSMRLIQLFSSDLTPKPWVSQLPSDKPLLLLVSRQDSLRPAEKTLLRRAQLLTANHQVQLYSLPVSAWATTRPAQEAATFAAQRPQLLAEGRLWRTAPGPAIVYRPFQDSATAASFTSPGAIGRRNDRATLFDGPLPGATDTTTYELSFWVYGKTANWMPAVRYQQLGSEGQVLEADDHSLKDATEISGDWVRYSRVVRLQHPANRVVLEVYGDEFIADDLLIRPRSTAVYWLDQQGQLVFNGFPLHVTVR